MYNAWLECFLLAHSTGQPALTGRLVAGHPTAAALLPHIKRLRVPLHIELLSWLVIQIC